MMMVLVPNRCFPPDDNYDGDHDDGDADADEGDRGDCDYDQDDGVSTKSMMLMSVRASTMMNVYDAGDADHDDAYDVVGKKVIRIAK